MIRSSPRTTLLLCACQLANLKYTMYIHNCGVVMSKHKSHGKDKKKGCQLVIRVNKAERDGFVMLCDQLDTSAARETRRFMREFVAAHSGETAAPSDESKADAGADANESEAATHGDGPVTEVPLETEARNVQKSKKKSASD